MLKLYKRNLRQGVGDFLHTVLQGASNHSLEHKGDVGLDGNLHLTGLSGDWQHLNPQIEGQGRLLCLELDTFVFLALNDAQLDDTHGVDTHLN